MNSKKISLGIFSLSWYFYNNNKNNYFHGFSFPFFGSSKNKFFNSLYIWGNGIQNDDIDNYDIYNNYEPKKIENLSVKDMSFKKIKLGLYFDIGINLNNEIYVWKKHTINSNKKSKDDNLINDLKKIKTPSKNILDIQLTEKFLWILDKNGNLFKYEILNKKDELINNSYVKVKTINNLKKITSNINTLIMLDKKGDVYSMGDDTLGQCGQGLLGRSISGPFLEIKVNNPTKINFDKKIIDISSGFNHSLAINENGELYGWGSNHYIQLGDEIGFKNIKNPELVKFNPYKIENENFKNIEFNLISCGDKFSIMGGINKSNNEMEIFGSGFNLKGQLGNGNIKHYSEIKKLDSLSNLKVNKENEVKNVKIEKLKCGKEHCLALTNINIMLEWGNNSKGQLGNKDKNFKENPLILSLFNNKKIIDFDAGYYDSFVIIEDN